MKIKWLESVISGLILQPQEGNKKQVNLGREIMLSFFCLCPFILLPFNVVYPSFNLIIPLNFYIYFPSKKLYFDLSIFLHSYTSLFISIYNLMFLYFHNLIVLYYYTSILQNFYAYIKFIS